MKNILTIFLFFFSIQFVNAKIRIPVCFPCENIAVVKDLPENDDFKDDQGNALKLGYMYKEYGIVFIPVWNSEGKYVLTNESADSYLDLSETKLQSIKDAYKLDLSSGSPLSFWKKIGGKILTLFIIILFIWGSIPSKKND